MTDDLAGQSGDDASAPSAPAASLADIEKLKSETDERIKGFQRLLSERDRALADLQRKVQDAELESLPADDRARVIGKRRDEEYAALRAENELLKLRSEFPTEVPAFERLLRAANPKEQLEILRELAQAASPKRAANEPPDVDPNNPMRSEPEGELMADGTYMTDALADRLLAANPAKGALFRLRGN